MSGPWPIDAQHAYSLGVIKRFGFDESFARLDLTVHPFAASSGTQDIRLTTRYKEDDITSIFTAMHECGHGLYEHVSPSLERTPLCHGVSSALHESQSRMWRTSSAAAAVLELLLPVVPGGVPGGDRRRRPGALLPRDQPGQASHIRVDADEATYNLHIILRFELEQEIFAGTIDLPTSPVNGTAASRSTSASRCRPTRSACSRTHWSSGDFGYFPTYSLGNIVSVQIWEKALGAARPARPVRAGEFGQLHEWLQTRLYTLGRKFTPQETLERVVGTPTIDAAPHVRYLKDKLAHSTAA